MFEGAFLQGEFTGGEEIYIEVPQGWEEYYDDDTVLLLNVSICITLEYGKSLL